MLLSAFLDTCVLVPSLERDVLLEAASRGAFHALWSNTVEEELTKTLFNLSQKKGMTNQQFEDYINRLLCNMNRNLPSSRIIVKPREYYINLGRVPDPLDEHILEAAILSKAEILVTKNVKDFPSYALPAGLTVNHPDTFLTKVLETRPDAIADSLRSISTRSGAKGPYLNIESLLDSLGRSDFRQFASNARQLFT